MFGCCLYGLFEVLCLFWFCGLATIVWFVVFWLVELLIFVWCWFYVVICFVNLDLLLDFACVWGLLIADLFLLVCCLVVMLVG